MTILFMQESNRFNDLSDSPANPPVSGLPAAFAPFAVGNCVILPKNRPFHSGSGEA